MPLLCQSFDQRVCEPDAKTMATTTYLGTGICPCTIQPCLVKTQKYLEESPCRVVSVSGVLLVLGGMGFDGSKIFWIRATSMPVTRCKAQPTRDQRASTGAGSASSWAGGSLANHLPASPLSLSPLSRLFLLVYPFILLQLHNTASSISLSHSHYQVRIVILQLAIGKPPV